MKILVTGATGFVGGVLVERLARDNQYEVIAATRKNASDLDRFVKCVQVADLSANTDWVQALTGVEVVIHAAARVHIMNDKSTDALSEFRKTNVQGTLNLARQAANAGIKRFIFISSIKAMGEESFDKPFAADDICNPTTPYGISKYEAEQGLQAIATETGMEIVIIRPPLVYGNNAKGNLEILLKLAKLGIPLPFAALHNKRSLVSVENLVDFIIVCISNPAAANQTFFVSDAQDLSTTQMIKNIGKFAGKTAKKPIILFPFPKILLKLLLQLIGEQEISQRIYGSLQVNIEKNKQLLGWTPRNSTHHEKLL